MVTLKAPTATGDNAIAESRPMPSLEDFSCAWDQDLRAAGIEHQQSVAIRLGVPLLALAMLGAALVVAVVAPDSGQGVAPLAIGLIVAAALPWAYWLFIGDTGPTWTSLFLMMTPLFALGIGHWFVERLSLGSSAAYPLLAFPLLLVVVLGVAVAEGTVKAVGIVVMAFIAFGGPLLGAWASNHDVDGPTVATWHVGLALAVVAGYTARLSYSANLAVSEAREALARREAAEERRQVARDVHDVVAHTLAVTMLHITAARMAVNRSEPDAAAAALEEAERHGRASLADIRRMVRLLRADESSALDAAQPGLADVEALVDGYRAAGLAVDFSFSGTSHLSSPNAELAMYRILQEALTNAARHGQGAATVDLKVTDAAITLSVGNTVQPDAARTARGSGLLGMRERIAVAGGTIEAGIRNGRWTVEAVIPGGMAR
jgi:signal transduction histidine kinase